MFTDIVTVAVAVSPPESVSNTISVDASLVAVYAPVSEFIEPSPDKIEK